MANYSMAAKNPFIRAKQFCAELRNKRSQSSGDDLSVTQLSFRSGYCQAMRDFAFLKENEKQELHEVTCGRNGYEERPSQNLDILPSSSSSSDKELNDVMLELALTDDHSCKDCLVMQAIVSGCQSTTTMECNSSECLEYRKKIIKAEAERRISAKGVEK